MKKYHNPITNIMPKLQVLLFTWIVVGFIAEFINADEFKQAIIITQESNEIAAKRALIGFASQCDSGTSNGLSLQV